EVGDRPDQTGPIGMFEVEQGLEVPVQVIRQVGELIPERLLGVTHHRSTEGTSSMAARRARGMDGASSELSPRSSSAAGGGASTGALVDDAPRSAWTKAAMSASLPKFTMPYTSCR